MLRRTCTLLLLGCLFLLSAAPRAALAGAMPPAPVRMPGGWWAGAVPPGAGPDSPVLVFVAGLHQPATSWWGPTRYYGNNDMYATAYAHGLRTAFAEMPGGASRDMWENGRALAAQVAAITAHFGVQQVVLVTHSKGGVDANAAAAFYGAAPRLAAVITLSAPHWGSPLADLAMSRWALWLAELVGERDAGVRFLQTGYMQWFRSVADGRPDDRGVPYYTISGTGWGPAASALHLGGLYLSAWGPNDGMVPEVSAHKPGAMHLATLGLDHDATRTARVWPALGVVLSGAAVEDRGSGAAEGTGSGLAVVPPGAMESVLRGGIARPAAAVTLPVERGARRVTFGVLTSAPAAVTVAGPDGRRYATQPQAAPPGFFAGAHLRIVSLQAPAAGEWRVEIAGQAATGYLVAAGIDSPAMAALRLPAGPLAQGTAAAVGLSLSPALAGAQLQASVSISPAAGAPEQPGAGAQAQPGPAGVTGAERFAGAPDAPGAVSFDPQAGGLLPVPAATGVYNLAVTLRGRLADGSSFERSFATSVAVAPAAGDGPPGRRTPRAPATRDRG